MLLLQAEQGVEHGMRPLLRVWLVWSAVGLACSEQVSALAQNRIAVFCERGFPYFAANELVAPRGVAQDLRRLGLEADLVSAADLASPQRFSRVRYAVLVHVYGNTFPRDALDNLMAFRRAGGAVVATGVPFTHPCRPEELNGRIIWRDEGHQDHSGSDQMDTGQVQFTSRPVERYRVPEEDPLRLRDLKALLARLPAGAPTIFNPATAGDRRWQAALLGEVADESGPVAILVEGGTVGPTALLGLMHFTDPREPAVIVLQQQLLLRGVGWCLDAVAPRLPRFPSVPPNTLRGSEGNSGELGGLQPAGDLLVEFPAVSPRYYERCTALAPQLPPEPRLPLPQRPPPDRLFPLPPAPAPVLTVLDMRGLSWDEQLLAVSLQGVVNQRWPRVYLLWDDHDRFWLDGLREKRLIGGAETAAGLTELVARFRGELRGAVLTDERWTNIACMAAGVRRLAILTPATATRYPLPIVLDLLGKGWQDDLDGYCWAKRELWPRMSRRLLGHLAPRASLLQRDFLIAQKVFLFWIPGAVDGGDEGADPLGALLFARALFAETPPHLPVCGWWGWGDPYEGIGEYWGMTLASRYGKTTPGTEFASNLSLLSAVRVPEAMLARRHPLRPCPELRPDRAYVALDVLDSGDAVWYLQRAQRDVWADPARGSVPIGWSFTPSMLDFAPAIAAWYQEQATPLDELMAACSGLNYCSLREYGRAFEAPQQVRRHYLEMSGKYMERLGIPVLIAYIDHWGAPTDFGEGGLLSECAQAIPSLRAIFPDLGRPEGVTAANANYVLREGVPVFHTLTRWRPWQLSAEMAERGIGPEVAWLLQELKQQVPVQRPCFLSAFPLSWTMPPRAIRQATEALPGDVVPVLPSELARLFMQHTSRP